ncbi:MAG: hypothetical protein AAGE76_12805 [Pseudomonadota bacterium]
MSQETIALIATATLSAILLGWETRALFEALAPSTGAPVGQPALARPAKIAALCLLAAAAVALNLVPHTRTEVYLLRIGLLAVLAHGITAGAAPAILGAEPSGGWRAALDTLRLVLALVAFWSFLHYAMNPRLPDAP